MGPRLQVLLFLATDFLFLLWEELKKENREYNENKKTTIFFYSLPLYFACWFHFTSSYKFVNNDMFSELSFLEIQIEKYSRAKSILQFK